MRYTVKEVAELSHVTIKTLHHYHKIGLLLPCEVSEAGYRLYGTNELERLQQILFYRELDFPLEQIKTMLENNPQRLVILTEQEELLRARQKRLETIIGIIGKSIAHAKRGETMDKKEMFQGFASAEEWNEALREHHQHLQDTYGAEPGEIGQADVGQMNEQAAEAMAFMQELARSLQAGVRHDDEQIRNEIRRHLAFLRAHGHTVSAADFAAQTRFFLQDDFHRSMLEGQQIGLAYYLCAAAEANAAAQG